MTAIELLDLRLDVRRGDAWHQALDGVSIAVEHGSCLGVVGESGCGKSLTLRAAIGLLPAGTRQSGGEVRFAAEPGRPARVVDPRTVAGRGVAMVFQDSHSSLDPTMRVGRFIAEAVRARRHCGRAAAARRAVELLADVGVPAPELRANAYPHELSGGLRQRAAIALALATDPTVLLCDEPTSALDVTVQAQLLSVLVAARRERGLSVVFVSHDVAAVRQIADVVAVMYAGRVVEAGPADSVFEAPHHPYTRALIDAVPAIDQPVASFGSIEGAPPDPAQYDAGCRFRHRCPHGDDACARPQRSVPAGAGSQRSACVHAQELDRGAAAG